jgi:hypothetical protein
MSALDSRIGRGKVKFWCMDNEPMIWGATHDDVFASAFGHANTGFMDYWTRYSNYAPAMKKQNPGVLLVGPEENNEWFWFYSMTMAEGIPFYEWFIKKCADYEKRTGLRILDVLSFHFYPNTGSSASTVLNYARTMWDPAYDYPGAGACQNFYGTKKVQWLHRLKAWIATYYAGTPVGDNGEGIKLGFTETDFGGTSTCGLLYADFVGVFSREGLDLFTPWQSAFGGLSGNVQSQYYYTMWMYTHFYGDTAVECNVNGAYATSTLHAYASLSSATNPGNVSGLDGTVSIAVLNKSNGSVTAGISLDLAVATNATVYQYRTGLPSAIATNRLTDFGSTYTYTFQPRSFTIIVAAVRDPVRFTNLAASPATVPNSTTNRVRFSVATIDVDGTVTNVSLDLTPLSGGARTAMTLTNSTGSTSYWKCVVAVPPGLQAGIKPIVLSGSDNAGFQGSAATALTVSDALPPLPTAAPQLLRSAFSNVVVRWQAAWDETGVAGYLVLSGSNAGVYPVTNAVAAATVFTDRSVFGPGRTWHYSIIALDAAGNAGASSADSAVTIPADRTPPAGVTGLVATAQHLDGNPAVRLSWDLPSDPDRTGIIIVKGSSALAAGPDDGWTNYAAGDSISADAKILCLLPGTATEFADRDVDYGDTVFYGVYAFDAVRNYSPGAAADADLGRPSDGTVRVLRNFVDGRKGEDFCRIHFEIEGTNVKVSIDAYNAAGEIVWSGGTEFYERGIYEKDWSLRDDPVSSGSYICVVRIGNKIYKRKIIIIR